MALLPLLLGACQSGGDNVTAETQMQIEDCRASAGDQVHLGRSLNQNTGEMRDAFENAYRACMAAKGYTATPSAP